MPDFAKHPGFDLGGLTNSNYTLQLLDLTGRVILRQHIEGQQALHTSILLPGHFQNGTCFLQLIDQNGHKMAERQLIQ
jgi:hypothetical protein